MDNGKASQKEVGGKLVIIVSTLLVVEMDNGMNFRESGKKTYSDGKGQWLEETLKHTSQELGQKSRCNCLQRFNMTG